MNAASKNSNVDSRETEKFGAMAARWWDPEGDMRTLHDINPARVEYLNSQVSLGDKRVVDVGCGGGLLSEALAERGARVTGIDAAERALEVARLHAGESGLEIDYRLTTAEALAADEAEQFDLVCCLELLEHVPEPSRTVRACAQLCRPGGSLLFSTINRSALSWAAAVGAAEYVLGLVPRGTHRYDRLIRPEELASWCRQAGLVVRQIVGMRYNPISRGVHIGSAPRVNYFLLADRPK